MAESKSVIEYEDLPEIEDRDPYSRPSSHLRRNRGDDGFEIVDGRRGSEMFLVYKLRSEVDKWRENGYPGLSGTTRALFFHWFEGQAGHTFRPYWGQRESIETVAYLVEIMGRPGFGALAEQFERTHTTSLTEKSFEIEELPDGSRSLVRLGAEGERLRTAVPPEELARYALKLATGAGKTFLMALVIVWSYFHKTREEGSPLSTNFLVLAPNVIVFDRLKADFDSRSVFDERKLVPPGWNFDLKVILRGDPAEPTGTGNLFVTNIQQLYGREDPVGSGGVQNAVDALLGRKPDKDLTKGRRILDRVRELPDVVALNDEAHHVHDEDLEWSKSLMGLVESLPNGLPLWLDFSATPKDQGGTYFPWIICDYPLAQAVEDRIVKTPLVLKRVNAPDPAGVTKDNAIDKYEPWLNAGLERFKEHESRYEKLLSLKPVMFVMAEKIGHAKAIGEWFSEQAGFSDDEVLVIHTDAGGDISKGKLDELRDAASSIDDPDSPVRVVVSVLVLREGWDVRNVTVVLGLRPGTAAAGILPEQAVGRGLRLMPQGADWHQTLEVMGTPAFEAFVEELETEGVPLSVVKKPPRPLVVVAPEKSRLEFDIEIPKTGTQVERSYRDLSKVDPAEIEAAFSLDDLEGVDEKDVYNIEYGVGEGGAVGKVVVTNKPMIAEDVVADISKRAQRNAHLTGRFSEVVPIVASYLRSVAFKTDVDLEENRVRIFLSTMGAREKAAKVIGYALGNATVKQKEVSVEPKPLKLSDTDAFPWRREWSRAKKTVFNFVATHNSFESDFGKFLDDADDVLRFAALAEYSTGFFVDYVKPSGALGRYFPDWVLVQMGEDGANRNWIIETKGRVWEGTELKDAAIQYWCEQVSERTGQLWNYMRVNQGVFDAGGFDNLTELVERVAEAESDGYSHDLFTTEE